MEKKIQVKRNEWWIVMLRSLLIAYVATGLLLLVLALLLYQFHLQEKQVDAGITAVYVIATFVGGFLCAKKLRVRKYLWGLLVGSMYFLLLVLISFGVYKTVEQTVPSILVTFLLCAGGGTLGGMLS